MIDDSKIQSVLDALSAHELIKAVVVVDDGGRVKGRRGQARCLRGNALAPPDPATPGGKENVYLARLSPQDFVMVVFDESTHFDSLKRQVDQQLASIVA